MVKNSWENFYQDKLTRLFVEKNRIIDIGGGLGITKNKGNRYKKQNEWLIPYLKNKEYLILDPVSDYNPDIIGDIHALPFKNETQDAIICYAVLEHVLNPFVAISELHRVMKPGAYCFIYIPFLFYYHPMKPYYNDYWRFTNDGIRELCKDFNTIEIQNVYGALETLVNLLPIKKNNFLRKIANFADRIFHKTTSHQTSGYYIFLIK